MSHVMGVEVRSKKLCLDCGRPSREVRCPTCTARKRTSGHGNAEYRKTAKALVTAHINLHGYFCLQCERTTPDLTVDHIRPLAAGGSHDPSNLRVICRSCNSRKGDARNTRPIAG